MASFIFRVGRGLDLLKGLKMLPFLKRLVEHWDQNSTSISVLVTGKTGTGKSTLINGIIGKEVAKPGHSLDPETTTVRSYPSEEGNITINVFDSPGLQDGTHNEPRFIADIKKKCSDVDLIVYCIRMSEDRVLVDSPDVRAMMALNKSFGHDMWKHTIFLLTFANDVVDDAEIHCSNLKDQQKYFNDEVEQWKKVLQTRLIETVGVPPNIVEGIAIIPAGHKNQPMIPDATSEGGQCYWMSKVWLKALGSTKPHAQLALIKLNIHRMITKQEQYKADDQKKVISQHKLVFKEKGSELAEALGVPASRYFGEIAGLLVGCETFLESLVLQLMVKADMVNKEDFEKNGNDQID